MKTPELIVWEDHVEPNKATWDDASAPEDMAPLLVHTVGFVLTETNEMLEIARDWVDDKDHPSSGAFLWILKKCVVSRKPLA